MYISVYCIWIYSYILNPNTVINGDGQMFACAKISLVMLTFSCILRYIQMYVLKIKTQTNDLWLAEHNVIKIYYTPVF